MPEARETTVCFRLWSDGLVPSEVTERLGIAPSLTYAKGEVWQVSRRTGRPYVARTGGWHLETALPRTATLDEHFRSLLQQLLPCAGQIRTYVKSGCEADFFCGIFLNHSNEGSGLDAETIAGVAALGAEIVLDIYSMTEGEE